jgi:hypothetical protein
MADTKTHPTTRFRANPVEIAVFSVVTLVLFNSVYNLFFDPQGFHASTLTPMAANPVSESNRAPASAPAHAFVNIDVRCQGKTPIAQDQETGANKVRMTGAICTGTSDPSKLVKTVVLNGANRFNATVFADTNAGKFSTDYIPLNAGKNPIKMEFTYADGKTVVNELTVIKN